MIGPFSSDSFNLIFAGVEGHDHDFNMNDVYSDSHLRVCLSFFYVNLISVGIFNQKNIPA